MLHDPDVYVLSRALHTAMTMTASERHFGKTVETLYNQRAWLVMMANSYVQNMEASQDIVNDSFIALLENIDRLDDAVLKSFLATTVKNKCLNYLRRVNCEKIIHRIEKISARCPVSHDKGKARMFLLEQFPEIHVVLLSNSRYVYQSCRFLLLRYSSRYSDLSVWMMRAPSVSIRYP